MSRSFIAFFFPFGTYVASNLETVNWVQTQALSPLGFRLTVRSVRVGIAELSVVIWLAESLGLMLDSRDSREGLYIFIRITSSNYIEYLLDRSFK
jgi:tellurite resistance protein TehA-like permease